MNSRSLTGVLAVLALFAFALPASAQLQRGAIYGTVVDNTGAVLPGVTVTLSSNVKAPQSTVSGSQGEFRFGELDPGVYTITASLQGFAPFKRENIIVNVGSSIQLPVQMALQGVQQQVTVTAATPVLDERTHGNTTTFGDAVLNEIPTARDPWVLLQQVPGVVVDRVNVGGSESGQQSVFSARGDNGTNTMWNLDGVTITDMAATGSSPTYYDFDVFQEVQFSTGLVDPRQQTGALGINLVTKRGTNDFHGLGRFFFDNNRLQSTNLPSSVTPCAPGVTFGTGGCFRGNRIDRISDYGGDVGGPIVKNKLWFWGSLARNDINLITINDLRDNTRLDSASAKIDFQATAANHANFFYYRGNKIKKGRNAGVTRPQETTWDQDGPTNIYKFEDSHTFGQHFLATGRFAYTDSGFGLIPEGGMNQNVWWDLDAGGVWHGSYLLNTTQRPQYQANVDASYFQGKHEVRFGFQYRRTPLSSVTAWPNGGYTIVGPSALELGDGVGLVTLTRAGNINVQQNTTSGYIGDTISLSRVTFEAALRYDRQNGYNRASTVTSNTIFPEALPGFSVNNASPEFTWNSWSPRVGATVRLNDKTNVRASYAMYQAQLPTSYISSTSPVGLAGVTYVFTDPGNHVATPANIDFSSIVSSYGFDPTNPGRPFSPNLIDPGMTAPRTHSVIVGLDRELIPNFALSTSFGIARYENVIWAHWNGLTPADFVQTATFADQPYADVLASKGLSSNLPIYMLSPDATFPLGSGATLSNRQGYHQRYWNWDITATKRLANRWMFRGYLTLDNHQEFYDNPSQSILDPQAMTSTATGLGFAPWITTGRNGGIVVNSAGNTSGSRSDVFLMSKWSYSLMGLYQFPLGIQASGTVYGRQGYPSPYYYSINRSELGTSSQVMINNDLNAVRNPNVHVLDLRAEKSITVRGVGAVLSLDAFNVTNNNVVLQRNRQINSRTFGSPREIVAPRVFRLGVRFQF